MAANNMINPAVDPNLEDELFAKEVEEVKRWWSEPRWRYTKRPFTAEQIVNKRGNLKIEYASNTQSKKLWNILEKRFKVSSQTLRPSSLLSRGTCPKLGTAEGQLNSERLTIGPFGTGKGCQLHIRLLGAHCRHPDGQVPRHRLRLGLAVVIDCLFLG